MKKDTLKTIKRVIRKTTPKLPPNRIEPNSDREINEKEDIELWEDELYSYREVKGDE